MENHQMATSLPYDFQIPGESLNGCYFPFIDFFRTTIHSSIPTWNGSLPILTVAFLSRSSVTVPTW
jgi:hypothetical protein